MKRMLSAGAMLLILGAALVLVLGGCTGTVTVTVIDYGVGPDGYVVNAKTGAPVDAASVTLTKIGSTTVYTETTDSSGYYSFSEWERGQVELTATKTGMAFTKQVVEIAGVAQMLPNIGGFTSTGDLTIIVFWDRGFADVDAYLTYPTNDQLGVIVNESDFYDIAGAAGGFAPGTTPRTKVYWNNKNTGGYVSLDVDNRGLSTQQKGGPETITVSVPWIHPYAGVNPYNPPSTNNLSKLPTGFSYEWVGVCEYYLDAFTSSFTATGVAEADAMLASIGGVSKTANPSIYVFYGEDQLARYTLPQFTDIKTAAILRVNMFVRNDDKEYFQIIPDTRLISGDTLIKSLAGNDGIIVAGGKVRR